VELQNKVITGMVLFTWEFPPLEELQRRGQGPLAQLGKGHALTHGGHRVVKMESAPEKFIFCEGKIVSAFLTSTTPDVTGSKTKVGSKLHFVTQGLGGDAQSRTSEGESGGGDSAGKWSNICTVSLPRAIHCATISPSGTQVVVGGGSSYLEVSRG